MSLEQTRARFQTTRWTLIGRLHDEDPRVREAAMDAIVRRYWPAVYARLRREGYGRDEAAEVVQHFFADVVLGRKLLERTEQQTGRLRSLLLTSLRNFVVDRHRRREARGGGLCIALDAVHREEAIMATMQASNPDEAFERRWALAAFEEALARCEQQFTANGRERHWGAFHARIVAPARSGCEPPPLANVAPEFGFSTPADAAAAIQVVKRRMLLLLREVAAESAERPEEQEEEYQRMLSLLA